MSGVLYCGDNLDVLKEYVPDESVDLIYLDPPFNSKRTFNIVYKDSRAQEEAFKDYWSWGESAATYARLVDGGQAPRMLRSMLKALHVLLIDADSDLLAYLVMMTARLIGLHRVLKPTGSLYLHCDPTASHYLKVVLDCLFGDGNFRNEIIWKRTKAHNSAKRFGPVHDTILFYARSDAAICSPSVTEYSPGYLEKFKKVDPRSGKRFQDVTLSGSGTRNGESGATWRGHDPTRKNRHWAIAAAVYDSYASLTGDDLRKYPLLERLERIDDAGLMYWPEKSRGGLPRYKFFLTDAAGVPMQDVWTDIDALNSQANERLGYPTQKPVPLLQRILRSSTNAGDLVLDPFCGCGTTIEACERLGRRWIGIDIASKAVEVIERRFDRAKIPRPPVVWHPVGVQAAQALAARDKHQFEKWVRRKLRATKRKRDRGIDGEMFFRDGSTVHHAIVSVKGGKVKPGDVRDLRGTLERERATVAALVTAQEPTKEMGIEAANAGFLDAQDSEGPIPRIQIVGLDRIFSDLPSVRCPGRNEVTLPAPSFAPEQLSLGLDAAAPRPAKKPKPTVRRSRPPSEAPTETATPRRARRGT